MTRGRKATPTALKKLRGNPGKRKISDAEPKFERKIPTCPKHITGEARKEWRRLCTLLDTQGLLTQVDRAALAAYCQAYARWAEAEQMVKKSGAVLRSEKGGFYQNPYLSIANRAIDQMIKIGSEFGMSPSSRTRLKVEKPSDFDQLELELFGPSVKVAKP